MSYLMTETSRKLAKRIPLISAILQLLRFETVTAFEVDRDTYLLFLENNCAILPKQRWSTKVLSI